MVDEPSPYGTLTIPHDLYTPDNQKHPCKVPEPEQLEKTMQTLPRSPKSFWSQALSPSGAGMTGQTCHGVPRFKGSEA